MILPNAGSIVLASGIAQIALPKIGPRRLVATGVTETTEVYTPITFIMVTGFGFGLAAPPLTDAVMAAVPVEDAGLGSLPKQRHDGPQRPGSQRRD